ncbi:MAG: dihydroneopterin aldolase [Paramuribaculum sp.]|nr:dihydroneopterin aldolase [Paramuribaculum sp.]
MDVVDLPPAKSLSIEIDRLRVYAFHGVTDEEKRLGTWFEVSCELQCPVIDAVENDRLDSTIDYALVISLIQQEMAQVSNLIEHAAERIRRAILLQYPIITGGWIKVSKLNPPVPSSLSSASATLRW